MKKLLFILLCFCALVGNAQDPSKLNILPPTPNIAAMERYGSYEVSLFTGLPQINIPLYEIKTKGLSMPISLSYHASGIKVTDVASWVGLGWNLNVGGAISRKAMGKPDEQSGGYLTSSDQIKTTLINTSSTADYNYLDQNERSGDVEPDIFSYNLPNRSGKFLFNRKDRPTNPIIFIPHEALNLQYLAASNQISEFNLTDEGGTLYKFGTSSNNQVYTENTTNETGGQSVLNATTAWLLTDMISAEDGNDKISLTYANTPFGKNYYDELDMTIVDDRIEWSGSGQGIFNIGESSTKSLQYVSSNSQKPKEIIFPNGKVVFELSTNSREDMILTNTNEKSLSKIKIYNKDLLSQQYNLLKTIVFNYDYFINTDNTSKRLRLSSIDIIDKVERKVQSYKFTYNTQALPNTLSRSRDYWGYFNGRNNLSLVPETIISDYQTISGGAVVPKTISSGNNRDVDISTTSMYAKACMLSRIDYPTGGYTEFDFESNQYLDAQNNLKRAGGLRVSQIRSFDGTNPVITKTYKYGVNESGAGRLNIPGNVPTSSKSFWVSERTDRYHKLVPAGSAKKRSRTYFANSSLDLEGYDGAPVVYATATEYIGTTSSNIGKTVYLYSDIADVLGSPTIPSSCANRFYTQTYHWQRGQLLQSQVYNTSNQLLIKTVNAYSVLNQVIWLDMGLMIYRYGSFIQGSDSPPVCTPGAAGFNFSCVDCFFSYGNYPITTGVYKLFKTTETLYDQNNLTTIGATGITNTTEYLYNTSNPLQLQPIEIRKSTSTPNEFVVSKMKYVGDYIFPANVASSSLTGVAQGIRLLQEKNIIAPVIEQYSLRQNININGVVSNARVLGGVITTYKGTQPVPDEVRTVDTNAPLPPIITGTNTLSTFREAYMDGANTFIPDDNYTVKAKFYNYDNQGNLLEHSKQDDVRSVYIWGYNGTLPTAQVANASKDHVYHTSFEDVAGAVVGGKTGKYCRNTNGAAYSLPNLPAFPVVNATTNQANGHGTRYVLSFWYCNGDPTKLADWKLFEQAYSTAPTSIPVGYQYIDEVRIFPENAMMTTYTYEPLVGVLSVTDPNNTSAYYVYDEFQRLKMVKDQDGNILQKTQYHYKGQPMKVE